MNTHIDTIVRKYTKDINLEDEDARPAFEQHFAAAIMEAVPKWQPIESAPKNGTEVLLWHGRTAVGSYVVDSIMPEWRNRWVCLGGYIADPTHWMPLPESPTVTPAATTPEP